jgi:hypothetical protein
MQDLRPGVRAYLSDNPSDREYSSGIAYVGKQHPSVLIIGSGGGHQVLDALHFGARAITAVEINPIINDVVSHRMNDYWGDLFHQPEVKLVTEEGRSYVRRSREQYDAIISVHTISNAAIASGALSLAENYVLTREAFEDYLDHLTPGGAIYFTRPEAQIARLFATAREALNARGVLDPGAHLYAYRVPPSGPFPKTRLSFSAGFLLNKSRFTPEEVHGIEALLGIGLPPRRPNEPAPEVLYSPLAQGMDSIYDRLLTVPDVRALYAAQTAQIEPATDDRPFFNHHTRWSSINFQTLRDLFTQQQFGRFALEDRPVAEVTLLVLLVQTVLIAATFILLPLAHFSREGLRTPLRWRFLLYFGGLGLGFILIEMALLSRFTLFLGQPVYTFAVVLASLLIFTGAGAFLTGRFRFEPQQAPQRIVPLLLLTLVATAFLLPPLFSVTLGLPLVWRVSLAVVVLAPLGLLLGMPFPTGLRLVSEEAPVLVPWCWGVNGFFTVMGTVAALMLGMTFGFKAVLLAGAMCYLLALAAIAQSHRHPPATAPSWASQRVNREVVRTEPNGSSTNSLSCRIAKRPRGVVQHAQR